jgi:hypothetical protein
VESLRLAKEENSRQSGPAVHGRGHYAAHMGFAAVEAGLESRTLLKVLSPTPPYSTPPTIPRPSGWQAVYFELHIDM